MWLYLTEPGTTSGPRVVNELLEERERQFTLRRVVFRGRRVHVNVHDVLGERDVPGLVVLILHDVDHVKSKRLIWTIKIMSKCEITCVY